jgi:hypothetical protein
MVKKDSFVEDWMGFNCIQKKIVCKPILMEYQILAIAMGMTTNMLVVLSNGYWGPISGDQKNDRWDQSHSSTTNSATSNIKVTDVSGARTSGETRPKNIRVVYIMKVF